MSVTYLDPHSTLTVNEALAIARRTDLTDVLVIGYTEGDDLFVTASGMNNEQSIMMAELFKYKTLEQY